MPWPSPRCCGSPCGPLSDDALVLLARRRWNLDDATDLAEDDALALARLRPLLEALRRDVDRLGPAALLESAIADTDYVAACAGGTVRRAGRGQRGEAARARERGRASRGGARAFLAGLRQLAEEEAREPEAPVVEERDPHAVRLLTVHAGEGAGVFPGRVRSGMRRAGLQSRRGAVGPGRRPGAGAQGPRSGREAPVGQSRATRCTRVAARASWPNRAGSSTWR